MSSVKQLNCLEGNTVSHLLKFQVFSVQFLTRLQSTSETQKESAGSPIQKPHLWISVWIIGLLHIISWIPVWRNVCSNIKLSSNFLLHTGWPICIFLKKHIILPHISGTDNFHAHHLPSHLTHHATVSSPALLPPYFGRQRKWIV